MTVLAILLLVAGLALIVSGTGAVFGIVLMVLAASLVGIGFIRRRPAG